MRTYSKAFNRGKKVALTVLLIAVLFISLFLTVFFTNSKDNPVAFASNSGNWTDSGNYNTAWYTGDGPYTVSTAAELAGLAYLVNSGTTDFSGKTVNLGADVDLDGHYWIPIGNDLNINFEGTFNGQNHTINNMAVDTLCFGGLFGCVENATLTNVKISSTCSVNVVEDNSYGSTRRYSAGGGLAGYNKGNTIITNCSNAGSVHCAILGNSYHPSAIGSGGLIGASVGDITISASYNLGTVTDLFKYAGGLIGYNNDGTNAGTVTIVDSYNKGAISAPESVGGIIGRNGDYSGIARVIIVNCYNTGAITATGNPNYGYASGIVGNNTTFSDNATSFIINSYNTGTISSVTSASGIICGSGYMGDITVVNCYNSGVVNGGSSSSDSAGGIVSSNSSIGSLTIHNSYNTGAVSSGGENCGAIIGRQPSGALTISDCYYLSGTASYGIGSTSSNTGCTSISSSDISSQAGLVESLNDYLIDNGNTYTYDGNTYTLSDWVGLGYPVQTEVATDWPDPSVDYDIAWYTGHESDTTYTIYTADELTGFGVLVNGGNNFSGKTVRLGADIDLSGHYWTPISTSSTQFNGTFDGQSHTISNMYVDATADYAGMFGYASYATLKNVDLSSTCSITSTANYVGALIGCSTSNAFIMNVHSAATVSGVAYVGGISGCTWEEISFSDNSGAVTGSDGYVGGIVGRTYYKMITSCNNSGNVTGLNYVGGIVGYYDGSSRATLSDSSNTGAISATGRTTNYDCGYAGGLCGWATGLVVSSCNNDGTVTAARAIAGGLIGEVGVSGTTTIINSYNTGAVASTNKDQVGGLIGCNQPTTYIINSYNAGSVSVGTSSSTIGAIVGRRYGTLTLTDCYYLDTASYAVNGSASYDGATSMSLALMQAAMSNENGLGYKLLNFVDENNPYNDIVLSGWRATGSEFPTHAVAVAYKLNGGTGTIPPIDYSYDIGDTFSVAAAVAQNGYTFEGWSDGADVYQPDDVYTVNRSVTVFKALWSEPLYWTDSDSGYDITWYTTDTSANPFVISNAQELAGLAVIVNGLNGVSYYEFSGKTIVLSDDIDLYGRFWTPIGNISRNFRGTFDGQDYVISNLRLDATTQYSGFFGSIYDAKIKRLHFDSTCSFLSKNEYYLGSFAGRMSGNSVISDSSNAGSVTGRIYSGGLVGSGSGRIVNSYNTGAVLQYGSGGGTGYYGGLAGVFYGEIVDSYNTGSVTTDGYSYVGGLVGNLNGTINNSYNTGAVYSNSSQVGGLVGYNPNNASAPVTILDSYNSGSVRGDSNVGGLIGLCDYVYIINSYSDCDVYSNSHFVGGLVGTTEKGGDIVNAYSLGTVYGRQTDTCAGGLVGRVNTNANLRINNSYSAVEITGTNYLGGIVGTKIGELTLEDCYYLDDGIGAVNGASYVGATGMTDSDMKDTESNTDSLIYALNTCVRSENSYVMNSKEYVLAIWKNTATYPTHGVTAGYLANGGTSALPAAIYDKNIGDTFIVASGITRFGNTFAGWSDGTDVYQPGDTYVINRKLVALTAQWTPHYWTDDASYYDITWYTSNTSANVYTISNEKQLAGLAVIVNGLNGVTINNFSGKTVKLGADIDLSGTDYLSCGLLWTSIGTGMSSNYFRGTFDGQGYIISNMRVERRSRAYAGFFGYTYNAILENVSLDSTCSVQSDNYAIGGLVGAVFNTEIINSYNEGTVKGVDYVGGLVGYGETRSPCHLIIVNCYNTGDVSGKNGVGGIMGNKASAVLTMVNTYNAGAVSGASNVGALIGTGAGSLTDCYYLDTSASGAVAGAAYSGATAMSESDMKGAIDDEDSLAYKLSAYVNDNNPFTFELNEYALCAWTVSVGNYPTFGGVTVIYIKNGGVGTVPAISYSYRINDSFIVADAVTRMGYSFLGWDDGASVYQPGATYTITSRIVALTAKWSSPKYWTDSATYYDRSWYDASKTVFTLTTAREFAGFASLVRGGYVFAGKTVKLGANIDLIGTEYVSTGLLWMPIGSNSTFSFRGTFDGQGYVISNMTVNTSDYYAGLFGYLYNATIENVTLDSTCSVNSSREYAGAISGMSESNCALLNVRNEVSVVGGDRTGGLIGYAKESVTVTNSYNEGDVLGLETRTGGFFGQTSGTVLILDCYNSGNVESNGETIGGFIGNVWSGSVNVVNSYNSGAVSSVADSVGGFIGSGSLTANNSYNAGNVTGNNYVGGFTGNGSCTINNSYNSGTISGTGTVGGFSGRGTVTAHNSYNLANITSRGSASGGFTGDGQVNVFDSYNVGDITGVTYAGGIAGSGSSGSNVVNSYNGGEITSNNNAGGLLGYGYQITVVNSFNTGNVTGAGQYIGGLIGTHVSSGTTNVRNSYNIGDVSGGTSVGGIVGFINGGVINVTNSYNAGSVTGTTIGALFGSRSSSNGGVANGAGFYYISGYGIYGYGYYSGTAVAMTVENMKGAVDNADSLAYALNAYVDANPTYNDYALYAWKVETNAYPSFVESVSGTSLVNLLNGYVDDNSSVTVNGNVCALKNWLVVGLSYPTFKVNVTYAADGGTGTLPSDAFYAAASEIAVTNNTLSKYGYFFTGWGDGVRTYGVGADYKVVISDVTFTAVWKLNWIGAADTSWYDEGEDEFTIMTPEQLAGIAYLVNDGTTDFSGKTVKLGADMDLSGVDHLDEGLVWISIGTSSPITFSGTFDGDNYVISNMRVDASRIHVGLFGCVTDAVIKQVTLDSTCSVVSSAHSVGGLVGYVAGNSIIYNSCNEGSVSGTSRVGGLIGSGAGTVYVLNSYNSGSVNGSDLDVGGIIGYINSGAVTVSNCYNVGNVISTSSSVGGILGKVNSAGTSIITNCYNAGSLSGTNYVGGIAGNKSSLHMTITNCYYLMSSANYGLANTSSNKGCARCTDAKMRGASGTRNNIVDELNAYVAANSPLTIDGTDYALASFTVIYGIYPQFTYKNLRVTYDAGEENAWSGEAVDDRVYVIGNVATIADGNVERSGYKFFAWKDEDNNYYAPNSLVTIFESLKLVAEMIESGKHMIYYEAGADDVIGSAPSPEYVNGSGTVTLADNTFIREKYNFEGWMIKPAESESLGEGEIIYLPGYRYTLSQDVIMIAVWSNKPTLVIDPEITHGTLSVTYMDNGSSIPYSMVEDVKVYYLDIGRTVFITATPDTDYVLSSMNYFKTFTIGATAPAIMIPFEDNFGTLYVEDGFIGVYTISATFTGVDEPDPVVTLNQEVWYGSVTVGDVTYMNCAIISVRIQLPKVSGTPVTYSGMKLRFTLTRDQVWEEGKNKVFTFNLDASDFDENGFYTASLALRRRDLDSADGVTADGYIMNADFIYGAEATATSAPQCVRFACGKQEISVRGSSTVEVEKFDAEALIVNLGDKVTSSGIRRSAIKWSSSDLSVANVDANGLITVYEQGREVTIKAYAGDNSAEIVLKTMGIGFTDEFDATVESVVLDKNGDAVTLTPSVINGNGWTLAPGETYEYAIEDLTVATLDVDSGDEVTITPHNSGMTYMIVTAEVRKEGESRVLTFKLPIYVCDTGVTTISPSTVSVSAGSTTDLTVASSASVARWEWKTIVGTAYLSDTIVKKSATVATITGKKAGNAVVAAIGYDTNGDAITVAVKEITVSVA